MCWNDWVELICSVLSALSLLVSAIVVAHHYRKKINVYALRRNGLIYVYGRALHSQEKVVKLRVLSTAKKVLESGPFLADGKLEKDVNPKEYAELLVFDTNHKKYRKIVVEIKLLGGKTYRCKCAVKE